ncbi:MAG: type III-A CRISPR-associated protein Csm2 [Candidatus Weimeria sp.]
MKIINSDNYVNHAEAVIKGLLKVDQRTGRQFLTLTTSKIRNLLAMTADIYNEVLVSKEERLDGNIKERIDYLRVKIIYECGRDTTGREGVRDFVKKAQLIECLKTLNGTRADYILFNRYMEALVAFHKYYGGKD